MTNIEVDYFKATFTSDGNTGDLEIDNNGDIVYKKLDEEELMKLVNVARHSYDKPDLLKQLKSEFPLKIEKTKTKKRKNNKSSSPKKNKKEKKGKTTRKSKINESIDNVFD